MKIILLKPQRQTKWFIVGWKKNSNPKLIIENIDENKNNNVFIKKTNETTTHGHIYGVFEQKKQTESTVKSAANNEPIHTEENSFVSKCLKKY